MAINLASKYSGEIDKVYTLASVVAGRANGKYKFNGVQAVEIYAPTTVPMTDYTRTGTNRYGTPAEMQDEVQELLVSQDKGFSLTIDKGNAEEQAGSKDGGARLRQQMEEQTIPTQDKYALAQYAKLAGKVYGESAAPAKTTIVEMLARAQAAFDNASVPDAGRWCYMGATNCGVLAQSAQVVYSPEIVNKAYGKGAVYECCGFVVVKVPDSYLPDNCNFVCFHKNSVVNPHKIADAKMHKDPPGISGVLLEGRFLYDAFVLGKKSGGVYASVLSSSKQANPTISVSGTTATITSASATSIKVTTDGSDPRYSKTATSISTGGTVTVGATYEVKAVAFGTFTSDVTTKKS